MNSKMIRIIDGHYNLQFLVEDGGYISVDSKPYQVRYLDETHFDIAGRCYHICQFGELVIDRGRDVRLIESAGQGGKNDA